MSVACQCAACGAKYQVGAEYGGRKIKCPKCSAVIVVGNGESASQSGSSKTSKAAPPKATPLAAGAASAASPGRHSPAQPAAKPAPKPAAAKPAAAPAARHAPAPAAESAPAGGFQIPGLDKTSLRHTPLAPRKKKPPQGMPAWVIGSIVGGGALLTVGLVVAIVMMWPAAEKPQAAKKSASPETAQPEKPAKPEQPTLVGEKDKGPIITMEWPEKERADAKVTIDNVELELPRSGNVRYYLPVRTTQYKFKLTRKGFQPIEFPRLVRNEEELMPWKVAWEPLQPGYEEWGQDFAKAQQVAKKKDPPKNVLIIFDRSDSNDSKRFGEEVGLRPEIRSGAGERYVRIYVDVPKSADKAKAPVDDLERNRKLAEKFGVTKYPTVIATDPEGRAVGVQEGYTGGGMTPFNAMLAEWTTRAEQVKKTLAAVDSAAAGKPKQTAIYNALDLLELHGLDRFYKEPIQQWQAALPKEDNKQLRPVSEVLAAAWATRFRQVFLKPDPDNSAVLQLVKEFEGWAKSRRFEDPNVGAGLYMLAAMGMAKAKKFKEAADKCDQGIAVEPTNPNLREQLTMMKNKLKAVGPNGEFPVGVGTGFCVAAGGYLMTNHHVIHGAKVIMCRLDGGQKTLQAKVIGDDAAGDMALLKIELPADEELRPLPLMSKMANVGDEIGVLGYPLEQGFQSVHPMQTVGRISSAPDADDANGWIIVDSRVNPGNSGGPLCSNRGTVAGIVSQKTIAHSGAEDTMGRVIPAIKVRQFLAKHLPGGLDSLPAEPKKVLRWDQVNVRVKPSVVFILNMQDLQHIQHPAGPGQHLLPGQEPPAPAPAP
jgi:S1-C subfamily serine protease